MGLQTPRATQTSSQRAFKAPKTSAVAAVGSRPATARTKSSLAPPKSAPSAPKPTPNGGPSQRLPPPQKPPKAPQLTPPTPTTEDQMTSSHQEEETSATARQGVRGAGKSSEPATHATIRRSGSFGRQNSAKSTSANFFESSNPQAPDCRDRPQNQVQNSTLRRSPTSTSSTSTIQITTLPASLQVQDKADACASLEIMARRVFISCLATDHLDDTVLLAFPGLKPSEPWYKEARARVCQCVKSWKRRVLEKTTKFMKDVYFEYYEEDLALLSFAELKVSMEKKFDTHWLESIFAFAAISVDVIHLAPPAMEWLFCKYFIPFYIMLTAV